MQNLLQGSDIMILRKKCICLQMQQHIWMKMTYKKKSSCFSFLFICTSKAQRNIKFAFFYGIRFIANRDMICMRQHQLALPSKMHVHKFHVSLFFMQIPLWKFHYIQPDMCIWFPSWSTIFPFFLISFHFFRCCLSHD